MVLVRAQLHEELPNFYRLRLGVCPAGDKALDITTEVGALRVVETMVRFIANVNLCHGDNESTTTTVHTTASNSPT